MDDPAQRQRVLQDVATVLSARADRLAEAERAVAARRPLPSAVTDLSRTSRATTYLPAALWLGGFLLVVWLLSLIR